MAELATCTLTHITELEASRNIVRKLIGKPSFPQALIRVGIAPSTEETPAPKTRLSLSEVLEICR